MSQGSWASAVMLCIQCHSSSREQISTGGISNNNAYEVSTSKYYTLPAIRNPPLPPVALLVLLLVSWTDFLSLVGPVSDAHVDYIRWTMICGSLLL